MQQSLKSPYRLLSSQGRGVDLSVEALTNKARWLRDDLEPSVARNGPKILAPDIVLELASFFSMLLTHVSTASGSSGADEVEGQTKNVIRNRITLEDLRQSRIHKAILVVAGRGTRWPGKIVDICDALVNVWTEEFGPLELIRPLLYETRGRLEKMKGERDLSRHALMVKWLGDPSTLVSPLQALEHGHLDFTAGSWWIHPIFAFHAGIIDSPDPHGGISADADGCYAILLTGSDEVASESPEVFTYRVRKRDKGVHRLLQAMLPPKPPVRILRSHTLRSLWSPAAGIRYDGLYRVIKYSIGLDRDQGTRRYDVTMVREVDSEPRQLPMRLVRATPNAEDVDDYIEYNRLREAREQKWRDVTSSRRAPKYDQLLGLVPALRNRDIEDDGESDGASIVDPSRISAHLDSRRPDDQIETSSYVTQESPSSFDGTDGKIWIVDRNWWASAGYYLLDKSPPSKEDEQQYSARTRDYNSLCSDPSAHVKSADKSRQSTSDVAGRSTTTEGSSRRSLSTIRPCANMASGCNRLELFNARARKDGTLHTSSDIYEGTSIDHSFSFHELHRKLHVLAKAITSRGGMSQRFYEDLRGMLGMLDLWEQESISREGMVDQCLIAVIKDVEAMRCAETVQ